MIDLLHSYFQRGCYITLYTGQVAVHSFDHDEDDSASDDADSDSDGDRGARMGETANRHTSRNHTMIVLEST